MNWKANKFHNMERKFSLSSDVRPQLQSDFVVAKLLNNRLMFVTLEAAARGLGSWVRGLDRWVRGLGSS